MKNHVQMTFYGSAVVVAFAAYLWASVTTPPSPVEWKNGDLIVQDTKIEPILPVFMGDETGATHIGIISVTESGPMVIEAAETVIETPLWEYIKRGKGKNYAAYRVPTLTSQQAEAVVAMARAQLGKPNDFFLDEARDQIYSSELVSMAYQSVGIALGRTQRLGKIIKEQSQVQSKFSGNWASNKNCKRRYLDHEQCWDLVARHEVITPAAIVSDEHVKQLFNSIKPLASPQVATSASADIPAPALRP